MKKLKNIKQEGFESNIILWSFEFHLKSTSLRNIFQEQKLFYLTQLSATIKAHYT